MSLNLRCVYSWLLPKVCHPSLNPAFLLDAFLVVSFLLFAPQQPMGQDCHAVGYDQARLCLLLITNMMALSIFTELPQYFIIDFSDQEMFMAFLQSHISRLFSLQTSSIRYLTNFPWAIKAWDFYPDSERIDSVCRGPDHFRKTLKISEVIYESY